MMSNQRICMMITVLICCLSGSLVRAQWVPDGTAVASGTGDQYDHQRVEAGAGNAIVTWVDSRGADRDIYVQKVSPEGVALWTANGMAICTATGDQYSPMIATDGAGGAIVTWWDRRGGSNPDIYAQRVDTDGNVMWTADGVAICTDSDHQSGPSIAADGSGGAVIAWRDERGASRDIYAQRVNASGAVQWTVDGVALCTQADDQWDPRGSRSFLHALLHCPTTRPPSASAS